MKSLNLEKLPNIKVKPIKMNAEFINQNNGESEFGIPSAEIVLKI